MRSPIHLRAICARFLRVGGFVETATIEVLMVDGTLSNYNYARVRTDYRTSFNFKFACAKTARFDISGATFDAAYVGTARNGAAVIETGACSRRWRTTRSKSASRRRKTPSAQQQRKTPASLDDTRRPKRVGGGQDRLGAILRS